MLLFAATTLEKIQKVPADFWIKTGLVLIGFLVLVVVLQKVAHMNKMLLGIVVFTASGIIFFSWIYNRNEPAFLTPAMNVIAPFFPSKGAYEVKQSQDPTGKSGPAAKPAAPDKKAPAGKKVY